MQWQQLHCYSICKSFAICTTIPPTSAHHSPAPHHSNALLDAKPSAEGKYGLYTIRKCTYPCPNTWLQATTLCNFLLHLTILVYRKKTNYQCLTYFTPKTHIYPKVLRMIIFLKIHISLKKMQTFSYLLNLNIVFHAHNQFTTGTKTYKTTNMHCKYGTSSRGAQLL